MSLPAQIPLPTPDGPRLEVRVGGRSIAYPLNRDEFVVGSGLGCDLRIPGKQVPATFCKIERHNNRFLLRTLSPTFPILVNGQTVNGEQPVALNGGDRLTLGPADAVMHTAATAAVVRPKLFVPIDPPKEEPVYLRPKLVREERGTGWDNIQPGQFTLEPEPIVHEIAQPESAPVSPILNLDELHSQLLSRSRELDERAAELESDRVLWYRRRQEMEQELQAPRDDHWKTREIDLATKELDLARARDELSTLRQSLYDQYRDRRDQLAEMQDAIRTQAAALAERERAVRDRESAAETRWNEADRLRNEAAGYDVKLKELHNKETQLDSAIAEIERQKATVNSLRSDLTRDRDTFDTERKLHESQWQENNSLLSSREADLGRRDDELRAGWAELQIERTKAIHALNAYDAKLIELEERKRELDRRAAEVDSRHIQLLREASDLEEQLKLLESAQQRNQEELDLFVRQREQLTQREHQLAERSSTVDSQTAALAVLRAALDRRQTDLQEQETTLVGTRHALAATQSEIESRLADAERLRNELGLVRNDAETERRALFERTQLTNAEREDLCRQQLAINAESERINVKEEELNTRTADLAEQAATLKARVQQVLELQERLEADRRAVRERELMLSESDSARLGLQDQLRKRAEELATRAKQLDATAVRFGDEKINLDRIRDELNVEHERLNQAAHQKETELTGRLTEIERQNTALVEREAALARQVARLREVGQTVAAERKNLFEWKQNWDRERTAIQEQDQERQKRLTLYQQDVTAGVESLHRQAPELEERAKAALSQLAAARDVLRGQLQELHSFAGQGRADLEKAREQHRLESDSLRDRERQLDLARAEHQHAVAAFRQQLVDWQSSIADLRQSVSRGETTIDTKRADLDQYAKQAEERNRELARREEELREARRAVTAQKGELDRHLADMRDWYKRKLRELAAGKAADLKIEEELSPGDRHLGELLRTRDLVDADTLNSLWSEATRQRKTLRQVLLSSGTLTLYQLALIEAGNLDGLMLDRFRIMDRIRSSPRETVYKVFDPQRAAEPCRGVVVLRLLGDAERHDAVRPDEYRQRFAALAHANHPNLGNTLGIIEVLGRPAAVQEWVGGVVSNDWPILPPGVWLKLLTEAVSGLAALHRVSLPHGRLTADSISLTPIGLVKVTDGGLPDWIDGGPIAANEAFTEDLRNLAAIAELWANKSEGKKGKKPKPLPDPLRAVLRRLSANGTFPMADEVAPAEPYPDADHLLVDLHRLAVSYPCSAGDWGKLLDSLAETIQETIPLKKAG